MQKKVALRYYTNLQILTDKPQKRNFRTFQFRSLIWGGNSRFFSKKYFHLESGVRDK